MHIYTSFYAYTTELDPVYCAYTTELLFLVGLAITGYGMGVVFHGDSGVYFIPTGFLVLVSTGVRSHLDTVGRMAAVSPVVYIFVLLVATYIAGDW